MDPEMFSENGVLFNNDYKLLAHKNSYNSFMTSLYTFHNFENFILSIWNLVKHLLYFFTKNIIKITYL